MSAPTEFSDGGAHDHAAERLVIGTALAYPVTVEVVAAHITQADFHEPRHVAIWNAIRMLHALGRPTDPLAVQNELRRDRRADIARNADDASYLAGLLGEAMTPAGAAYHADTIARASRQRRLLAASLALRQLGAAGRILDAEELDRAHALAAATLEGVAPIPATLRAADTLDHLATEEPEYDWLVPGLLERDDRVILTGPAGHGKSTLLRQIGIQVAVGVHPFTNEPIRPLRVLHIDLENSARQTRRAMRPLVLAAAQANHPLTRGQHFTELRPAGIDLLTAADTAWLRGLVEAHAPDLVITGPLYRMAGGDPTEEAVARTVAITLDRIRETCGVSVLLEAHSPHTTSGQRTPVTRPYGASLWVRWPEFGIHLAPDGILTHWRGARDEREWPEMLQRGGPWPFSAVKDSGVVNWQKIKLVRQEFGAEMTIRDVAEATGIARSTVHRLIGSSGSYRLDWDDLNGGTEGGT